MALTKFSSFKKERATIKESRAKEVKVKKFNKLFSEKLKELKVASVADLSEDQMNSFLESLKKEKVVNEDRMREIEAHGIAAGNPQELGAAGSESEAERAKKHTFTSPQNPATADDGDAKNDAAELQAEGEEIAEAKKAVKEDDKPSKSLHSRLIVITSLNNLIESSKHSKSLKVTAKDCFDLRVLLCFLPRDFSLDITILL